MSTFTRIPVVRVSPFDRSASRHTCDPEDGLHRSEVREYRCTRPDLYRGNCPGRDDPGARQGHYVDACCPRVAARLVRERLGRPWEDIDVQEWRPVGVSSGTSAGETISTVKRTL